jgi:ABC-type Na+ efflux pump permease subunit
LGLIGPLAGWELRRLARRGAALRVRLVVLYILLLAFLGFATLWFHPLPAREIFGGNLPRLAPAEVARFASAFALVLLEAQLVAVVVVTPALAAASVAEEKDRQTLPLLLTTDLTDREIVFGKATGRIAFVLATVLGGLPVLALTRLFGGVDAAFLVTGYTLTAGTVVLCAAIGIHAACRAPDLRSAILRAYGWTAILVCGAFIPPLVQISPFALLAFGHRDASYQEIATYIYPLAQMLVAGLILGSAARNLRLREPTAGPPPVSAYPPPPRPAEPPLFLPEVPARPPLPPLDEADPVLWKDRSQTRRPVWGLPVLARMAGVLATGLAAVLFLVGAFVLVQRVALALHPEEAVRLANKTGPPDNGGWFMVGAAVFAAGRYLLPVAVGVSAAIAGERFRSTLDALLATTLDRRAILRAKLQAALERGTAFAALAVAAVGMAFTADGGVWLGTAAVLLLLSGFGLVIGFGAWLTVRSSSDTRAFRLLMPVAVVAVGWPVGVWNLLGTAPGISELLTGVLAGAAAACAGSGLVLWWLAGRLLERGE